MLVRLIASAVIAALLLIGFNPSAPQTPETAITAANPVEQVSAAITPAPVQLPAPVVETTQPAITETEAQTIALTHAKLTADAVTALRSHLDTDDRIPHWDVEFRHGDWEYDYEISKTGEILHHEKELDPLPPAPTAPVTTEPAPTVPAPVAITAQQAQAIALTHAGLTADAVTQLEAHLDADERIPHWDVEFRHGDWEYDYEIGETGEILHHEKELDPEKPAPTATKKLSTEDAKALALTHAKLTQAQVRQLKAEFDLDDGIPVFEVEFTCGGWEYDYEIHAESGKILSWDKEWDD